MSMCSFRIICVHKYVNRYMYVLSKILIHIHVAKRTSCSHKNEVGFPSRIFMWTPVLMCILFFNIGLLSVSLLKTNLLSWISIHFHVEGFQVFSKEKSTLILSRKIWCVIQHVLTCSILVRWLQPFTIHYLTQIKWSKKITPYFFTL